MKDELKYLETLEGREIDDYHSMIQHLLNSEYKWFGEPFGSNQRAFEFWLVFKLITKPTTDRHEPELKNDPFEPGWDVTVLICKN